MEKKKEIKEFLETLHFHGYIDYDVTKLDNLIDDYYPKQFHKSDIIKSVCENIWCENGKVNVYGNDWQDCPRCINEQTIDTITDC